MGETRPAAGGNARWGRGRWGLAALLASTALLWLLAFLFPSRTDVEVRLTAEGAVGSVNGAQLPLALPAAPARPAGAGWYVGSRADSLYYQPADPSAPLVALGDLGAWLQGLVPQAHWRITVPAAPGAADWPAPPGTPPGARAAVAPQPLAPPAGIAGTLVRGDVYAGLLVYLDAQGNGYAFLVQPERRGIGWWQVRAGVPTTALARDVYRPGFWAAAADVIAALAIAATAALAFALAAALLVALLRLLTHGRPAAIAAAPSAASSARLAARRDWAIAAGAGLVAFAGALAVCLGPLEGIPHVQDSVAYLWQAKIFALGHVAVPAPPAPEFFDQGFILITDGRWFTKYPPGWPLLLVPGVLAGVPWLVNPLVAGLSVALITATAARLYGRAAAVATAVLAVTSPFFLFMSGSYMSHPAAMLAVAAALYGFVRLKTDAAPAGGAPAQPAWRRDGAAVAFSLLVGFALGWAFITREATAVGIAFPFAVWALADIAGAVRAALRRNPGSRGVLLRRLRPYGLMVLGALPPLVILGIVDQALLGSPFRLAQELVGSYDRLGFGPGFGPEPAGHSPALGLVNGLIYGRTLAQDFLGWPPPLTFGPLLLAVAALFARPWRLARWDLFLLGGFLGLAGIYFAWWSATTIYGPRYWYEGLPFLLILSGRGVAVLGGAAARSLRAWGARPVLARLAAGLVPLLAFGPWVLYDLAQVLPGQVRTYTGYNDVTASSLQRVAAAHLDHALVFVALQPDYPRRDYGKVFFANDPLLRGPVVYVRDLGAARDRGLLGYFPDRQPYYLPLDGPPRPGIGP